MEDYAKAIKTAKKVIKKQTNEHDIAKSNLIIARALIGTEKYDESEKIFKKIISNNRRTLISAEACYHLGGMFFQVQKDYEKAIEYFNKVKKEERNSEFVTKALLYSSIVSQIVQYQGSKLNISNKDIVEQQFKLAEYYIEELSQPDSALIIYDNVIKNEKIFQTKMDSLQNSLVIKNDIFRDLCPDSLFIEDSLSIVMQSVQLDTTIVDSVKNDMRTAYDIIVRNTIDFKAIENNFMEYSQVYVPFAYFTKIWVYKNLLQDMEKVNANFSNLSDRFPDNRYYFAASKLLNDEPVDFLTPRETNEIVEYEEAISLMETDVQSSVSKLSEIVKNNEHKYYAPSLYIIGYIQKFGLNDTTLAKSYFDRIIDELPDEGEILTRLSKFYDGEHFIVADSLISLKMIEAKKTSDDKDTLNEGDPENKQNFDEEDEDIKSKSVSDPLEKKLRTNEDDKEENIPNKHQE